MLRTAFGHSPVHNDTVVAGTNCPPESRALGAVEALQDLAIERGFVVAPVQRRYPLAPGVEVVPVWDVERIVGKAAVKSSPR